MCGVICRQSSKHIVLSGTPAAAGLDGTEWKNWIFGGALASEAMCLWALRRDTSTALLFPYAAILGDAKKNEYWLNRKTSVWNLMVSNVVSNNETPRFFS